MRSNDDDVIGVMFRYQDQDNYYRFSWDAQGQSRRLEKRIGGVLTVLARQSGNSARYRVGATYTLEILAQGSSLTVNIEGTQIFSLTDTSLTEGTIALYSHANAGSTFDDVVVEDLFTHNLLLSDNFDDGTFVGWTVVDEGTVDGPSTWSAAGKALVQSSNIGSEDPEQFGTYALYTKGSWTDYRVTLKMLSNHSGALGVMFRFQDSNNFYRFSWDQERRLRQLAKREKGSFKILAQDDVAYDSGLVYQVELVARGTELKVFINGSTVFSVDDTAFTGGTIALYSSRNPGSVFDDVLVEDLTSSQQLLWTDFNSGSLLGWTVIDEAADSESFDWRATKGQLVQSSAIGSTTAGDAGTFIMY
jgi:hypothetical protein